MSFTTRFAPSPTGPLHLGHAYSALLAHDMARANSGRFLLRIEDIDRSRARQDWERQIYDDLDWLGIGWETPVLRQSDRLAHYANALDDLWARGLLFRCDCSRRDVAQAAAAPQEGAPLGPDGIVYPGTCNRPENTAPHLPERPDHATLRLRMARAVATAATFTFRETGAGPGGETGRIDTGGDRLIHAIGDVVLARKDMHTSYHLSVVLDDAAQNVTHVIRGQDLFDATAIHVVLQNLLDLPTPVYHHHRLIRDDSGKRLAKRDDARAIARYRADGCTPQDIREMVGL